MSKKLRILTLDIETAPLLAYVWGLYDQNISIEQIKDDWSILVACAKFSDENEVRVMTSQGRKSDKQIVKELQALIEEADVLCSQNGVSFDLKKINARAQIHRLPPTKDRYHLDTLRISKKTAAHTSNKLAYLTKDDDEKKSDHAKFPGFKLWLEVMEGNDEAWKEMVEYCKQDVIATEKLAQRLIPWDTGIDLRNLSPQTVFSCRVCGSSNLTKDGSVTRKTGRYQTYRCKDCYSITTEKAVQLTPEQKKATKQLLTSERGRFKLKMRGN